MNYYLSSQSTIAREKFSVEAWVKVLSLAVSYGWRPMGTRLLAVFEFNDLEAEDWDGTYLTNDGQVVIQEDALSLAVALKRSLDDIPDFNIESDRAPSNPDLQETPDWLSPIERAIVEAGLEEHMLDLVEVHPFEYFAGAEKQHLIDFIKFCRRGSFTILRI